MIIFFLLILTTITYGHPSSTCNITIVESIPQYLTYESTTYIATPIWKVWIDLIKSSTKYIKINSLYWSMLSNDTNSTDISSKIGDYIFWLLIKKSNAVPVFINQDISNFTSNNIRIMKLYKNIKVDFINVTRLAGNGIQHSKLIIGDGKKAFIGSANMDWRALTQIKEIGAYITDCDELLYDLGAFWSAINYLTGIHSKVPKIWPQNTWPKYNQTHPLIATVNGVPMTLYTASSPTIFNPPHRTTDLLALITTITEAQKFILISVMDYSPLILNFRTFSIKYWPDIENAILTMAIDKTVKVKMLISLWNHSKEDSIIFLRSMLALSKNMKYGKIADIEIKLFIIPAFNDFQKNLPFSRVSHSKYMVTESTIYIGTSNWSGNYFNGTVGISLIAKENCDSKKCGPNSIRKTLEQVFYADWNSIYAHDL